MEALNVYVRKHTLEEYTSTISDNNEMSILASLDVQKAFDKV